MPGKNRYEDERPTLERCLAVITGTNPWTDEELRRRTGNPAWLLREAEAWVFSAANQKHRDPQRKRLANALFLVTEIPNEELRIAAVAVLREWLPESLMSVWNEVRGELLSNAESNLNSRPTDIDDLLSVFEGYHPGPKFWEHVYGDQANEAISRFGFDGNYPGVPNEFLDRIDSQLIAFTKCRRANESFKTAIAGISADLATWRFAERENTESKCAEILSYALERLQKADFDTLKSASVDTIIHRLRRLEHPHTPTDMRNRALERE